MRQPPWSPPVELSPVEQTIVKWIRRPKLFVSLREQRHDLLDAAFQEESGRPCAGSRRGGFGSRVLRPAPDSSPIWGAGRVEDMYKLLGHALRKMSSVLARRQGRGLAEVASEAGAPTLAGPSVNAPAGNVKWVSAAPDSAEATRPHASQVGTGQLSLQEQGRCP